MGMPCVPANLTTDLMDSTNCISVQTFNVEELSLAQFQTLITVPFSEILVIDESSQLKHVLPSTQVMVPDLTMGIGQPLVTANNNLVVYMPQEEIANEEAQMAQQWYEDSMVATQAMDFLSQVLIQATDNSKDSTDQMM